MAEKPLPEIRCCAVHYALGLPEISKVDFCQIVYRHASAFCRIVYLMVSFAFASAEEPRLMKPASSCLS